MENVSDYSAMVCVALRDPSGALTESGRPRYCTKSVGSEAEGKALLGEIEKAVFLGQFAAPANGTAPACDLTLMEAIDEYLTAKRAEGKSENGIKRYGVSQRAIAMSPLAHLKVADLTARDLSRAARRGGASGSGRGSGRRARRAPTPTRSCG